MSETAKSSSEQQSTRIEAGDVQAKLRGIARELDYGMPVLTREWRKRTAGELEALASEWVK